MKVLKDLIARAGATNQVTIGAGATGAAVAFGSAGDAVIERVAADTLSMGSGDKLQQSTTSVVGYDVTNMLSAMFLG